jgi:hypothetical protein
MPTMKSRTLVDKNLSPNPSILINLQNQRPLGEKWFALNDQQLIKGSAKQALPIYCGSPFMGRPFLYPTTVEVWPDVNILAYAKNEGTNPNISALSDWIRENKFGFNVLPAYLEHHRTNDTVTAWDIAKNSTNALHEKYGFHIDYLEFNKQSVEIPKVGVWNHEYTDRLAYFVVVIRYLYTINTTFEKRCFLLAKMMGQKFPKAILVYLLACLYFYVKDNRREFPIAFDKLQEDMQPGKDAADSWKRARNFASDISFFTQTSLYPIRPSPPRLRIPYIATTDPALVLILQQLCYLDVLVNRSVGRGTPRYRPGSIAHDKLDQLTRNNIFKYIVPFIEDNKSKNEQEDAELKNVANQILAGTFFHKVYPLD